MAQNRRLLFDANSTDPISAIIAVAPGDCIQINAWNLTVGEVAQVYRVMVTDGSIGFSSGSCDPNGVITPGQILAEEPYLPCNVNVEVGEQTNLNITTIVLQQSGFYRLYLTPAALGTAIVEAIALTGADACQQAASACCCTPEAWWQGVSINPCLTITPGGEAGHAPIFNLDACCLFQSLTPNPNPVLSDELIFLSGGQCFRATIDQVFSSAIVCDSLGEQPLLAPAAGDQVVGLDAGSNCKRMDGETFVEFFETPWTGISTTPALVIAPGGINGHGPTFNYDLCLDIQSQPSCACEPSPGDQVLIVQGGACVLATWPTVDVCDQLGLLPNGALIAGDTVLVREAGGACKQVLATAFGGGVAFPLLAPDGSCPAPSYSFTSDPTSGMFYSLLNTSVVISNNNCEDFIEIGNSVDLNAATSFIRLRGGYLAPGSACGIIVETNAIERLRIGSNGAWNLNTLGGGNPGQVITSFGSGTPPQWVDPSLLAGFGPILGSDGSCAAPTYSFNSSPDSGMFYDPAGLGSVVIGDDNCLDSITIGASIAIRTNNVLRHTYTSAGAWNIGGSEGLLGQAIVSNGPGVAPTWQTPSGVAEPITQVVYGTGPAVDSTDTFLFDVTNGRFTVNSTAGGGRPAAMVSPAPILIFGRNATNNGASIEIRAGNADVVGASGGGGVTVQGGNGGQFGNGGLVEVIGGSESFVNRSAGGVTVRGGTQTNGVSDTGNRGGTVTILGGPGGAGASGGDVLIQGGNNGAGISPATNNITLSFSGVPGNGTSIQLFANPTTTSRWTGGTGVPTVTKGQDIQIEAGSGHGATLTSDSGDLFLGTGIRGGHPAGTGEYGHIVFYGATTPIGRPLANINATTGDVCLAGSGGPVPGAANTTLPLGATGGFTWLPRIASNPTGVPNGTNFGGGGFSGYANPVVIEQEGGQTCFWVYNFAAAAWHSTCFNAAGAVASVAEPNTQIVYGTGAAVDSSAFFYYDITSGRFGLNENTGPTRLSLAAPNDVTLAAATNTASVGRTITLAGGNSTADNGGQVFINGGDTSSATLNRRGGDVTIRGGQPAGGFQHGGGHVFIHGGNASVSSQFGGDVIINYGTEGVSATQNSSTIFLGRAGGGGGDGGLNIPANPNQLTTLRGTTGRPWAQTGSSLVLQGGSADNSGGPNNGGDVRILTGEMFAGGVKGRIDLFADQGAFDSPIAHFTGSGDSVMAGYGQGTNGTQNTALLAGATTGFLWFPRIAAAPTGVPAGTNIPGGTVYANPIVVQETGGTIVLHIYEFGAAAWRSVALT